MIQIKRKRERGQSFVELSLTLVFLLILFSTTVDLAWAFYTLITLRDSVQEAAAYGAICPFDSDNITANTDLIEERLRLSVTAPINMDDFEDGSIEIRFTNAAGTVVTKPEMGGSVIVRATIQHQIVTPFVGAFIGTQSYPLMVEVADTVMRNKWLNQCDY